MDRHFTRDHHEAAGRQGCDQAAGRHPQQIGGCGAEYQNPPGSDLCQQGHCGARTRPVFYGGSAAAGWNR